MLGREEVLALLRSVVSLKHRVILTAVYAAGQDPGSASGDDEAARPELPVCPVCGESMILVRTIEPGPRYPEGIDSS